MSKTDKRLHDRCQIADSAMQDRWDLTFNNEVTDGKATEGISVEEAQTTHRGNDPVDPSDTSEEGSQEGQRPNEA